LATVKALKYFVLLNDFFSSWGPVELLSGEVAAGFAD
jgi:hypothetical protein